MEFRHRHIKFRGTPYILIGLNDGAITTERAFREGRLGVAHLTSDGVIMQDGIAVGTRDDIEFGDSFTPSPMFTTPSHN